MSALSPRQFFLLDQACKPIAEAFGEFPYLVGTAGIRGPYRDVDIRLMLDDAAYDNLRDAVGAPCIAFLGLAIGEYLASLTGLPIDFQVQRTTEANAQHEGPRNPIGCRSLANFAGDCVIERPTSDDTCSVNCGMCPSCVGSAS